MKKEFLAQMSAMIPCGECAEIIRLNYYKSGVKNRLIKLLLMPRIRLWQNLYSLPDRQVWFEKLHTRKSSELWKVYSSGQVSDGDRIERFHARLVENGLQEKLFYRW